MGLVEKRIRIPVARQDFTRNGKRRSPTIFTGITAHKVPLPESTLEVKAWVPAVLRCAHKTRLIAGRCKVFGQRIFRFSYRLPTGKTYCPPFQVFIVAERIGAPASVDCTPHRNRGKALRVCARKTNAFLGQRIHMGRLNMIVPVTPYVCCPQGVQNDHDEICLIFHDKNLSCNHLAIRRWLFFTPSHFFMSIKYRVQESGSTGKWARVGIQFACMPIL